MAKPRLLDLFCGAGGAAMGYHRAGFEVVGVDIKPQPNYPFEFIQADALEFVGAFGGLYDAIHASPPCQAYSQSTLGQRNAGKEYVDLLGPTRKVLEAYRAPWVIENVPNAPMRADVILCGSQFGLPLVRHRWFEFSERPTFELLAPCSHDRMAITVTGRGTPSYVRKSREKAGIARNYQPKEVGEAMGTPWMTRLECSQAIPPAYTEFIGQQLLRAIGAAA